MVRVIEIKDILMKKPLRDSQPPVGEDASPEISNIDQYLEAELADMLIEELEQDLARLKQCRRP